VQKKSISEKNGTQKGGMVGGALFVLQHARKSYYMEFGAKILEN